MAKYNKDINEWVVPNLPRDPFYNVGAKISIHGQEITVKSISPCHSVSGPIGCLLKRDEELPNSYFHFLGFQLYFDREINWFVGAKITSILDARIDYEVLNVPLQQSESKLMNLLDRVFPDLPT